MADYVSFQSFAVFMKLNKTVLTICRQNSEDENLLRLLYWTGIETIVLKASRVGRHFTPLLIGTLLIHKVMVKLSAIAFRCRTMGKN